MTGTLKYPPTPLYGICALARASTVLARLQEKNIAYKEEVMVMEKELASIEEEKSLILSNMADTLAAGSDAEMAVRCPRKRKGQGTGGGESGLRKGREELGASE